MSRRLDIELTNLRDPDTWTWRAVGAREPKGTILASLVPPSANVGDELRVEADFFVEGIEITLVLPSKGARKEPEMLELLGSGRSDPGGVTTSLVSKRGKGRGDRGDSRGDRDSKRDSRSRGRGERGAKTGERATRDRPRRPERPAPPAKPKPKRLRPQRAHRNAALAELPPEQRPIAEQVLRGGIPGVRKAIADQNEQNSAADRPKIDPAPLLILAETMLSGLKQAEWHDRADAALAGVAEVDLRDLRSVVVAAESNARNETARALAEDLRQALTDRVDSEHSAWLAEMVEALDDDRAVRALRMSSRPPKAGAPLPPDLSSRLAEAANASLAADTGPQRWGTVLDAVAFSPVRALVAPQGIPERPNDELLETVKRLSTRVPDIAALFGIEPQKPTRRRRKPRTAPDPKPPAADSATSS